MKKIYYLQKHPVKIGDVIEHNGFRATVTEELIELNPELFLVKDTMQELLDKAKRDYPVGTVLKDVFGNIYTVSKNPSYTIGEHDSILINDTYVYRDDRWAEVLPLKFTTEDGVDIYGDMKTYLVHPNDSDDISSYHIPWDGGSKGKGNKYFYHKENALAYIKKHREKTLRDYENMLLRTDVNSINAREECLFYHTLKKKETKLYYTKILQLIADDLNDGWVADFNDVNQCKYSLKEVGGSYWTMLHNYGAVYFKSEELSEKARNIMGSKLEYLFK